MATYRVQATFEIPVTVEYTMEDTAEAEADAREASDAVAQHLLQRAEDRAAALAENLTLTMYGCAAWELGEIVYGIDAVEEVA
jgi:hypothetical protein